uniref:Amine oxidase domain-containing protein n=1 Tax=Clastoptera arizonana TaxID=38151 RepID=A0A1B6C8Z2_9HEMI
MKDIIKHFFKRQLSIYPKHYQKPICNVKEQLSTAKCQNEISVKGENVSKSIWDFIKMPKVVIIGAGMSGLSAAQSLFKSGLKDFVVLEATNRPGGRIHSCWLGNLVAEMGAQLIYGDSLSNPVFTLACQEGLIKSLNHSGNLNSSLFLTSDGRAIDPILNSSLYKMFKQIEHQAYSLFTLNSSQSNESLMNFFSNRIKQELQNFPENQRYDIARVMFGLTNTIRNRWGVDLAQMSAYHYGCSVKNTNSNIIIPQGFVGILAPLIQEIPANCVKYSKPVKTISWCPTEKNLDKAVVQCDDGEEFLADYVIVTVSLGVLKTQFDKLFTPALSGEKLEAVKKLGYGCINKIFMEYKKPFWVEGEGNVVLSWSSDELNEKGDWVKGISFLGEVPGSKHVMQVNVTGPEAVIIEELSDNDIAEDMTCLLCKFTGDLTLPYPSNILKTKWSSDPYFVGASSYMALDSTIGQQYDLGMPLCPNNGEAGPVILFAGEATCPEHFATVQGARFSGIREAERIIQFAKDKLESGENQAANRSP